MARLEIEPGAEYLLPFARSKLAHLKRCITRWPHWPKSQVFFTAAGERIEVVAWPAERIKISGVLGFGWGSLTDLSLPLPVQGYLVDAKIEGIDTVGPPAPFSTLFPNIGGGYPVPTPHFKDNKRILGWAATNGLPAKVWIGFLDTYVTGGAFEFTPAGDVTNFPASLLAVSADQKSIVHLVWHPAINPSFDVQTFDVYRHGLAPVVTDGVTTLNPSTVLLASSAPSDYAAGQYDISNQPVTTVDRDLREVVWPEYSMLDRPHPPTSDGRTTNLGPTIGAGNFLYSTEKRAKVIAVDAVSSGRREVLSIVPTDTYYGGMRLGFSSPYSALGYFEDLVELAAFSDGAGTPWAAYVRSRYITTNDSNIFGTMWSIVTLYRGTTIVLQRGTYEDGTVRLLRMLFSWVSLAGVGIALAEYTANICEFVGMTANQLTTPTLPEFRMFKPPAPFGSRTLLIIEGTTLVYEGALASFDAVNPSIRRVNTAGTAVLASMSTGPIGLSVIEKDDVTGVWAKHDVVLEAGVIGFSLVVEGTPNLSFYVDAPGKKFVWVNHNHAAIFAAEGIRAVAWTVRKVGTEWRLSRRNIGNPAITLRRPFATNELFRI